MSLKELNIEGITNSYSKISLEEMDNYNLLNRYDIKYLININDLPELLEQLVKDYRILEHNNQRFFTYNNQYFDTPDYYFYKQHHNGKLRRSKIRYRHYVESGLFYFEIKNKANIYITTKDRLKTDRITNSLSLKENEFVKSKLNIDPGLLLPKLFINYNRFTLLHSNGIAEKITIDTNLNFRNTYNAVQLHNIAIIEIKLSKYCRYTTLTSIFKALHINSGVGFSKYCMGLALADSKVKYNRFKPKIIFINKLSRNNE